MDIKAEEKLNIIKNLMRNILLCPNGINGTYRPIKNTTRQACMNTLGKIQELLETNKISIDLNVKEFE